MSNLDILVLSVIAAVACYPAVRLALGRLPSWISRPAAVATKEEWQQRWTHTLIELLADLERDGLKPGATLCRELMWEILGGDQGGKK